MSLRLLLLGPFTAMWGQQPLTFSSNASRALLAYLAIESDRPQPRELVAALFWPEQSQSSAFANLRLNIHRLRRALPAATAALQVAQQSLWLLPDETELDLRRFGELLTAVEAHDHADIAACAACIENLENALALYSGELLQGMALESSPSFGEWLLFKREALHQQALDALAVLVHIRRHQGDFAAMRSAAARQVELEPWSERAHLDLMQALLGLGQRGAALAQYEACRQVLAAELGIAPSRAITALYQQLRQAEAAPQVTALAPQSNLPAPPTPFIGRQRELAALAELLSQPEPRLLTLLGAGGMGKTRLAIQTAQEQVGAFADGAYFVPLAALADPAALVPAIAATLAVELRGGDPLADLLQALRGRQLLLILDNFEHLIGAAGIVGELLAGASRLRIIVTSREQLLLRGERLLSVDGLYYAAHASLDDAAGQDAVRLFVQTAAQAQGRFRLDEDNLAAVLRICSQVEGMPLGLELAAGWTEALTPAEIGAEIARNADFLSSEWRDMPARQRSMRAVFEWSWQLLAPEEQRLLRQLAVFRGGFSREAAEEVAGAALPQLLRLRRKSLLRAETSRDEYGSLGSRLGMHELLRQYASEQLQQTADEWQRVHDAHSAYYLDFVAARQQRLRASGAYRVAAEMGVEIDNIRQAWAWAVQQGHGPALMSSLWGMNAFYYLRGWLVEATALFRAASTRLLELGANATQAASARSLLIGTLLVVEANLLLRQGFYQQTERALAQASELAQAYGDPGLLARWAASESRKQIDEGHFAAALARLDGTLDLARAANLPEVEANIHLNLGIIAWASADFASAEEHMRQAQHIYQASADAQGEVNAISSLGILATWRGAYSEATGYLREAQALYRAIGDTIGEAIALGNLANVLDRTFYFTEAVSYNEQALLILRATGSRDNEVTRLTNIAELHLNYGNYDAALTSLLQSLAIENEINNEALRVRILRGLTRLNLLGGNYAASLEYGERTLNASHAVNDLDEAAVSLMLLGNLNIARGRPDDAARFYQQVIAQQDELSPAYHHTVVYSQLALAELALARSDATTWLAAVDAALAFLAAKEREVHEQPLLLYLTCYRLLQATGDPRATAVLQTAQQQLELLSNRISDSAMRRSFLDNVPANLSLREASANTM